MADQRKVLTSYDSGGNNTATKAPGVKNTGDWGNDTPENSPPDNQDDDVLKLVMDDFKIARDYVKDNYQNDWNDYWKCYNLIRTRRGYEGVSDTFVPESFTIIESVKANIAGGKPKFRFTAMNDKQEQDTGVINQLCDYYWEKNSMTIKAVNWVNDMLIYGNGVLYISWENDAPCTYNIPLSDFFVDPTATQMTNPEEKGYPRYAGYRYLTDRDTLQKRNIINVDSGAYEDYYKNLNDIPNYDGKWDEMDKDVKEGFLGSTLGRKAVDKQVECIVYFTKKKKIVIANRQTIIYDDQNPYYRNAGTRTIQMTDPETGQVPIDKLTGQPVVDPATGQPPAKQLTIEKIEPFLPFAVLRNYVDSSLFYAKGDMAILIDQQERLNDLSNQQEDNVTFVNMNMWQIDPQFAHLKDQIESVPGAVFPIPRGALTPIEKGTVGSEIDTQIDRIKEDMRRATAADEIIQGASTTTGRQTATEVTATVNQANQRFTTKLNILENEGYKQLANLWFKMVQIFVNEPMAVRIVGPEGTQFTSFDPDRYGGMYEPRVTLDSTSKQMSVEEGQKYLQIHELYGGSLLINQQEFAKIYLGRVLQLPEEQINDLLNVDPNATLPMPQPNIRLNLAGQLQPDQLAQILAKEGIQSSQADLMLGAGIPPEDIARNSQTPPGAPAVPASPDVPPGMLRAHEAGLKPPGNAGPDAQPSHQGEGAK